jgi:ribonuclease-3
MHIRLLEKTIGYRFRRKKWLHLALTHPSYRHENTEQLEDNQRLEYLGDAVLGLLAAHALYQRYPDATEGELSKLRSGITRDETLAAIAERIDLGSHLRFGRGEAQNGGASRKSNLADALEALLGAAWKDSGQLAAQKIFNKLFSDVIEKTTETTGDLNPKGTLQEYTQQHGLAQPTYESIATEGPDHSPTHTIHVHVFDQTFDATAGSKREAEQRAAEQALLSVKPKNRS